MHHLRINVFYYKRWVRLLFYLQRRWIEVCKLLNGAVIPFPHRSKGRQADVQFFLGVDGGGTATRAVVVDADMRVLGRGRADGPSNPRSVGLSAALVNIDHACQAALSRAAVASRLLADTHKSGPSPVATACLALAGVVGNPDALAMERWVVESGLADRGLVVADMWAVLAVGCPDLVGAILIAGTGAIAFARTADGFTVRSNGWGPQFGDEGSGFALAVAGVRAVLKSEDGRGPATSLTAAFLEHLKLQTVSELANELSQPNWDRARIASLAPLVSAEAEVDRVALSLLVESATELSSAVQSVVRRAEFTSPPTVAGSGGLILHSTMLRERVEARVREMGCNFVAVEEPAVGAAAIAKRGGI